MNTVNKNKSVEPTANSDNISLKKETSILPNESQPSKTLPDDKEKIPVENEAQTDENSTDANIKEVSVDENDVTTNKYETPRDKIIEKLNRLVQSIDSEENDIWEDETNVKPEIPTRMIMKDTHQSFAERITTINVLNSHKNCREASPEFITEYNRAIVFENRRKRCTLIYLFLSTLLCIFLLILEIGFFIYAIYIDNECGYTNIYLIISALFHCVIIIIEWLRLWTSQVNNHYHSRKLVDLFLISTAGILVLLYVFCIVWYAIGFAWVMTPYTELLGQTSRRDKTYIVKFGTNVRYIMVKRSCNHVVVVVVISYQIIVFLFMLFRSVAFCFTTFCKGFIIHLTKETKKSDDLITPYIADNKLNTLIPPVVSLRYLTYGQGFLKRNHQIHSDIKCMIHNHPKWKHMN